MVIVYFGGRLIFIEVKRPYLVNGMTPYSVELLIFSAVPRGPAADTAA